MEMEIRIAALTAVFIGVASHLTYFIRGEHHLGSLWLLALGLFSPIISSLVLIVHLGKSIQYATILVSALWWSYFAGLFGSMLVYRAFFHRLRTYPGPFMARLSKLWFVAHTLDLKAYKKYKELHATYGDYVRTGPSEISVADPDIVEFVHGPRSTCSKSAFYDNSHPLTALQQMRGKEMHARRRRGGWDKAFNAKSLRAYDNRVNYHANLFISKLQDQAGKVVDASKWVYW